MCSPCRGLQSLCPLWGFQCPKHRLRLNSSLEPLILLLWSDLPPQPLSFSLCLVRVSLLKSLVLFRGIPTWGSNVSKESVSRIIIDILRVTIIFLFCFYLFQVFVCQISLNQSLPGKFYFLYILSITYVIFLNSSSHAKWVIFTCCLYHSSNYVCYM